MDRIIPNRIENLELWSRNHGAGQRYEDLAIDYLKKMGYKIIKE
jgi:predicted GNAT family acetyltransferase